MRLPNLCAWCGSADVVGRVRVEQSREEITGYYVVAAKTTTSHFAGDLQYCGSCQERLARGGRLKAVTIAVTAVVFGGAGAAFFASLGLAEDLGQMQNLLGCAVAFLLVAVFGAWLGSRAVAPIARAAAGAIDTNSWGKVSRGKVHWACKKFGDEVDRLNESPSGSQ